MVRYTVFFAVVGGDRTGPGAVGAEGGAWHGISIVGAGPGIGVRIALEVPCEGVGDGIAIVVLVLARSLIIDVDEDVDEADEVFMSGNMMKVTPVNAFNDTNYQNGPITKKTRELYWDWAKSL